MPAGSTNLRRRIGLLGLALSLGLVGCGKRSAEYAEVEGKVTLSGHALPGVVVTYYPLVEGQESLPYATGTANAAGVYTLATADGAPGAVVGKNRVVVNWPPRERNDNPKAPRDPSGPPIPLKYTVAGQTPLVFDVKPGGRQIIDLALTR